MAASFHKHAVSRHCPRVPTERPPNSSSPTTKGISMCRAAHTSIIDAAYLSRGSCTRFPSQQHYHSGAMAQTAPCLLSRERSRLCHARARWRVSPRAESPGALDEAPCPHTRLAPHCRPAVPATLDRGGWCRCGARPGSQRDVGACFTEHDAGDVLSCVRRRIGVQRQHVEGDEASPGRLRGVILYSLPSQFARSHTH